MSRHAMLIGLTNEPPMAAVERALNAIGAPYVLIDQRELLSGDVQTWWTDAGAGGVIELAGAEIQLDRVTGVYTRLTTWTDLPGLGTNADFLAKAHGIHVALDPWLETTSVPVINRTSANDTNHSKPYQAMIIRDHFDIPATLVTNDPEAVVAFQREYEHIVYKSVSGERSIVSSFGAADAERLHLLAHAPVQFQEHVTGVDVRVHVVGTDVFASRVDSEAVDYRYAETGSSISPVEVSDRVAAECVALTTRLGLVLSGIDLRYAHDGRLICFEVNPSPAFSVYEDATGQPIAAAIARFLSKAVHDDRESSRDRAVTFPEKSV